MRSASPPVRVGRQATGPGFCVSEVVYAPGWRQPRHAHESAGVTLVVAGAFRETACGREESATALSVVVKPAGVLHADEIGAEGARTILVEIEDPALLPERLGPWRWLHAGPGVRPLLALAAALRAEARPIEDTVLDLLGEVSDTGRPVPRDPPTRPTCAARSAPPRAARPRSFGPSPGRVNPAGFHTFKQADPPDSILSPPTSFSIREFRSRRHPCDP